MHPQTNKVPENAIAVIGMDCRFPGANDTRQFWKNLVSGTESITFFTDDELRGAGIHPETIADPTYVRAAGIMEDAELFDAAFFGYTPTEAICIDPQQCQFLQTCWHALEDAGYNPYTYPGAVAVFASTLFPVDLTLSAAAEAQSSPSGIGEVLATLVTNVVANPVTALMSANYLGILAWAVVLGIALRRASDQVKDVFTSISDAVSTVVRWIISLAPFGILGLIYTAVSTNGLEIFTEYGQLLLVLVGCMLFIAFVTNPILSFACFRKNPYGLVLRCLKDSGLTAFFTRSSAANIPVNMELCRKLGLDKDNYSLSIPLGATINMGGAAVTISVMAMMAAHTLGIQVDIPIAIILSVLSAVSACGASGVAGGSLLLIPLACSLFGIGNDIAMQVVGIGFVIGVIQDSCETALNSSSDVLFAASAEYSQWRKEGRDFKPGKDIEAA